MVTDAPSWAIPPAGPDRYCPDGVSHFDVSVISAADCDPLKWRDSDARPEARVQAGSCWDIDWFPVRNGNHAEEAPEMNLLRAPQAIGDAIEHLKARPRRA